MVLIRRGYKPEAAAAECTESGTGHQRAAQAAKPAKAEAIPLNPSTKAEAVPLVEAFRNIANGGRHHSNGGGQVVNDTAKQQPQGERPMPPQIKCLADLPAKLWEFAPND